LFYNATQKVEKISTENIELFNPRNTKISYNYNIEKIETIENKLFIKGWLLEKGKNNAYINRIIVVKDNKNDYYKLFTKSNDREDINDYFGRKYDYNNVGLIAKGKLRKDMEYPLKIYFLIKEKNKSILVDTNQIIEKNQGIQKISIENFEILNLPKENVLFPYTIETTKIIDDTYFKKDFNASKLLGLVLTNAKLEFEGKCCYGVLDFDTWSKYISDKKKMDGIIDNLRNINGVEIALFMYETEKNEYKVSLRSINKNVSTIAAALGGGGHIRAAGATVYGNADEILKDKILPMIEKELNG